MVPREALKLLFENNRRSESEVIYDILKSAQKETKKTRLMYSSKMPYNHFQKYLDILIDKELLATKDSNPGGHLYYTTDKGNSFLTSMNIVFDLLKD